MTKLMFNEWCVLEGGASYGALVNWDERRFNEPCVLRGVSANSDFSNPVLRRMLTKIMFIVSCVLWESIGQNVCLANRVFWRGYLTKRKLNESCALGKF